MTKSRLNPIVMESGKTDSQLRVYLQRLGFSLTDDVVAADAALAALAIVSSVTLEGSSTSAETTLSLSIGGGTAMGTSTVAIPAPYAMTVDKVAISFLTTDEPGDWTARIYRRSSTFPLAEVGTMTFSTS
jgi:hypothetical protein